MSKIEKALSGCMTVADIFEALGYRGVPVGGTQVPLDAKVCLAADYGDRSHTTQLLPVEAVRPLARSGMVETGYSASGVRLLDLSELLDGDYDNDDEEIIAVVLGDERIV